MAAIRDLVTVARAGDPPARAQRGVVSAQHPTAAAVGAELFGAGGNVVDVAVATAFASTVADVGRTGIGGYGGHLVYHDAAAGETWLVDFPTYAPHAAREDMLAAGGSQTGPLWASTPAVVAGLAAAHVRFGRLAWQDVLAPAIRLADEGIEFGASGRDPVLAERGRALPETVRVLIDAWDGDWLRQPELARSLRRIAEHGWTDFYSGELADRIVSYLNDIGGVLAADDLASYAPSVSRADRGTYRGFEIRTPGSASGGGVLLPLLAALDAHDLSAMEPLGGERMALLAAETGRLWPERFTRDRGTSHFSVADTEGSVVACTTTLQQLLGSAVTVPGTGIVLNNGMGLFDTRPGQPNSIAAGKRATTNMCPTIVLKDGKPWLSSGASGGRRIPSMLVQLLTLAIDHEFSVPRALRAPRFHTEGDMRLLLEEGLTDAALGALSKKGFQIELKPPNGTDLGGQTPTIWFDETGQLFGAPDPRRHGGAAAI